jgi:uncharacterized membrane protein YeaQ/YmgE (transglycosylase-associated protein family)
VEFANFAFGNGIFGWIIVGLIAGWLADIATGGRKGDVQASFALGVAGALVGGVILTFLFGGSLSFLFDGGTGLIMSIVVAFVGAMQLSFIVRSVMGARSPVFGRALPRNGVEESRPLG